MTISSRRRRGQSGHVIVEMGLCMVALFFMIFGIVEYSNVNFANNFCAYAALQAARYASIRGSGNTAEALPTSPSPCGTSCTNVTPASSDPTTTYVQGLAVGLNTSNLTVTTTWSSSSGNANTAGGTVTVKVSYSYSPILAAITDLPTPFTMNSSATMTVIQ